MPPLYTRRSFLQSTALGGALGTTLPAFLASTLDQLHAEAADSAVAATTGRDAPILVVVQMAGGNDGLNTLVPFADDHYQRARPSLALKADRVLKLNDTCGLHPSLAGLRSLYDEGALGIVQAVGYPNPNRSHFRSTDIWMTATDSDRFSNRGWIGRYFDAACAGAEPTVGVALGRQAPLAFAAQRPTGVALENPNAYRFAERGGAQEEGAMSDAAAYRQMGELDAADPTVPVDAGGSVGMVGGTSPELSPLDFLERTALDAQISSETIRTLSAKGTNATPYPAGRLANDLKLVARLISGGLGTRIYYVSQGGYDTHANQAASHARLLGELGDGLTAFHRDLRAQGQHERVLVMTFSEFGRRVAENGSAGTDHGAAAPMLILGERVQPGIHGPAASLAPADLLNGDLRFRTDFRQVYATLLERWLRTPSAAVLGRQFPPIETLLRAA